MAKSSAPPLFRWGFLIVLALLLTTARGLSWGKAKDVGETFPRDALPSQLTDAYFSKQESKLSTAYTTALNALEKLRSEPLCHKTAAALLISNCEILDGKDDATVLTDSGRAATEFIDSFAASLAICDLERGNFEIPSACSRFQESTLAKIPLPATPYLHVTTTEIKECLAGLGLDHSTWNTWLSYKHKALSFCEAARAANKKEQSIQVNQRMTHILSNLTTYLEEELGYLYQSLDVKFRDIYSAAEDLEPQLLDVNEAMMKIRDVLKTLLLPNAQQVADSIHVTQEKAEALDQSLAILLRRIHETGTELEEKHGVALQTTADQANLASDAMMAALAAAVVSSTSLQQKLEQSQAQAAAISLRQENLALSMATIEKYAIMLRMQQENQSEILTQAQQSATEVLNTIQSVTSRVHQLNAFAHYLSLLWVVPLYVICPYFALYWGNWNRVPTRLDNVVLISIGLTVASIIAWCACSSVGCNMKFGNGIMTRNIFDSFKGAIYGTNHSVAKQEVDGVKAIMLHQA